jgi:hypothetical protein
MNKSVWAALLKGEPIQDCMKQHATEEREFLMSSLSPEGWDTAFMNPDKICPFCEVLVSLTRSSEKTVLFLACFGESSIRVAKYVDKYRQLVSDLRDIRPRPPQPSHTEDSTHLQISRRVF